MKVTNKNFISLEELSQELNLTNLDPKRTLIQIFTGLITKDEVEEIQSIIREKNSTLSFIGTTTAGEIFDGIASDHGIVVSIIEFDKTIIKYNHFETNNEYETGKKIGTELFEKDTKAVILLVDGFSTNVGDILDGIASINSTIPVAGGLAADNGDMSSTLIFNENEIYVNGILSATMYSDSLKIFTNYQLNWQPIGEYMTVTKVDKNHLYELNGINVSDIYRKYLGDKVADNLPWSATEFPLLKIEENGLEICRPFIHKYDDNSMMTVGNLYVGDKVRFSFGNIDLISTDTIYDIEKYTFFQPEAISVYSCAGRKAFLQLNLSIELKPLSDIAPMAGFFTSGEIYHQNNQNTLLSMSLTIIGFSEKSDSEKIKPTLEVDSKEKNMLSNKHFVVLEALTNLSNTVIEELHKANLELNETKEKIQEQANRDYLTNLYNRRYFNEVSKSHIDLAKRNSTNICVIIVDIDKFKNINDTYGHAVGDEIIKLLASILDNDTRKSDIVSRFGGEEFVILLPNTNIDNAFELAEKLRVTVENQKVIIQNNVICFTISLGVDTVNLENDKSIEISLDRADKALYFAKENGRNRVAKF